MNLLARARHPPPTTAALLLFTLVIPRPVVKSSGAPTLGVRLRYTLRTSARALSVRLGVLMPHAPPVSGSCWRAMEAAVTAGQARKPTSNLPLLVIN